MAEQESVAYDWHPVRKSWMALMCSSVTGRVWRWESPNGGWLHPKKLYRRVKWFCQRGWRGWADCDVWGFDSYLAGVMAAGLRRLAEDKHCVNMLFITNMDEMGHCPNIDADAERQKRWFLDKATWLEWYANDEDGHTGETNWIEPGLSQEEIRRRIDLHEAKVKKFYDEVLPDLGRHFGALWD